MKNISATSTGVKVDYHPFPAKLVHTFASSASPIEGLARELVDNSLDAEATYIEITVEEGADKMKNFVSAITVVDNGKGMANDGKVDELFNSFTFSAEKEYETDMNGKYGWGGTKVALQFAHYKETYTISDNSGLRGRKYDMDVINKEKQWCSTPIENQSYLSQRWNELWNDNSPSTGTAIYLTGFDKSVRGDDNMRPRKQFKHSVNLIKESLSEVHRKPLEAGVIIVVNGEQLRAACPIGSDLDGAETSEWKPIVLNVKGVETQVAKLRTCSLFECEKSAISNRFRDGRLEQHCGYAFTRNSTLVTKGILKGDQRWTQKPVRHPNVRFSFVQIEFTPKSDCYFGLQNTRDQVDVDAQLQQKISEMTKDFFTLESKKAQGKASREKTAKTKSILNDAVNAANNKYVRPTTWNGRSKWVSGVKLKPMGQSGATWAYEADKKLISINEDSTYVRYFFSNAGTKSTHAQEVVAMQAVAFEACMLEMNDLLDEKLQEQLRANYFKKLRMVVDV
jgi:hypothetical protein